MSTHPLALLILAADLHSDGRINAQDIVALQSAWGTSNPVADINGDGVVNSQDLIAILQVWGSAWGVHHTGDGEPRFVGPESHPQWSPSPFIGHRRLTFTNDHGVRVSVDSLISQD